MFNRNFKIQVQFVKLSPIKRFWIVIKFMFSKKVTKIEKNLHRPFDTYSVNIKSTVKIWSIFVAFLEKLNFKVLFLFNGRFQLFKHRINSDFFGILRNLWNTQGIYTQRYICTMYINSCNKVLFLFNGSFQLIKHRIIRIFSESYLTYGIPRDSIPRGIYNVHKFLQ